MTEQNLHDYNKWLTEVWSKQHSNIPFMQDAPNAYLKYRSEQLIIADVINWVAVSDSLPDHLEKVVMYGKRTEHNEPEIITGVLNRAGGLNDWNTYGIIMHEVTYWAKIKPPCL